VLKGFGIMKFFDGVYGADHTRGIDTKTQVLSILFKDTEIQKPSAILIGDTVYDAEGAKNSGIDAGIVLYGFGRKEDFAGFDIKFFCETPADVVKKITGAR